MAPVSVIRVIFLSVLISCSYAKFDEIRSQEEAFKYIAKKRYTTPKIDLVEASPILHPLLDSIVDELESKNMFEESVENGTTPEPPVTTITPTTATTKTPSFAQCKTDLGKLGTDFLLYFMDTSKYHYAAMMVDAYGKLPPGVLQGNAQWIGLYDQCMGQTKEKTLQTFGAQYCIAHALNKTMNTTQLLAIGICVPDSCSDIDLDILLYEGLQTLALEKDITAYVSCNKVFEYSAGAIACLVLLSIIGVLIVAGTSYEFVTIYCVNQDDPLGFKTLTEEPDMVNQEGGVQIHPSSTPNGLHIMSSEERNRSRSISGFVKKFLLCFSLITNGTKILKPTQGQGSLHALNGIRVLSLWWVILGHTYFFPLSLFSNPIQLVPVLSRFSFQAIGNATFSVDSFFFLSGLLITYLTLNYLKKMNGELKWGMFYLHRYLRLTPVYMIVIFVFTTLTPHFATGPMYSSVFDPNPPVGYETQMTYCQDYWWTNMLYINNLYPTQMEKTCLGWSWYLANDMQFFIITPFIIYFLYHKAYIGISICFTLLAASFGSLIGLSIAHDIEATPFPVDPTRENFLGNDIYEKPYTRISTYLVGMGLGYILYRYHGRVRMPRYVAIIGWLVATGIGLSVVYGLYGTLHGHELSRGASVMYITFCRFAWAIALAWVAFACITGYGGPINTLLSWPFWIPLSRINYCAYLLHPIIMMVFQYSLPTLIYFSDFLLVYFFLGNLVLTYSAAFIFSLCAEAPFMALEKLLLQRDKSV